ncbi:hypothetical protein RMCBS344292_13091 [Rhizopus microsporus]|nr:hypothetical protein RMCBS344292_13091 [Rhizopus microsporus]
MIPFFDFQLYENIRKNNLDEWNNTSKFPRKALLTIIDIAESAHERSTRRVNAITSVPALASTMDDAMDKKLAVSTSQLLQSLPMEATLDKASEITLITRYILPALQPLFDDDDSKTRLEFACSDPANIDEQSPIFNGCPDFTITVFTLQTNGGMNAGCGEVKRFSMVGSHFLVN